MTRISLSTSSRSAPSSFLLQSLIAKVEAVTAAASTESWREQIASDMEIIALSIRRGGSMDMLECWGLGRRGAPGPHLPRLPVPGVYFLFSSHHSPRMCLV